MNANSSNDDTSRTSAGNRRASHDGTDDARPEPVRAEQVAVGTGRRWPLFVIGGASLLAGLAAIAAPLLAGFAATVTLGVCLVFCGAIGAFAAFEERDHWQTAGAFVISLLAIVAGALMLLQPALGIVAIGTLIIAWFAASGVLRIYYGIQRWSEPKTGAGWMVGLGIASLIVAIFLWFAMPQSTVWLPGVILGVDLIFWGSLLVAIGFAQNRERGLAAS